MLLLLALRFAVFISSPLLLLLMTDDAPTVPLGIFAAVVSSSPSISKYGDFLLVVADNDLVDLARAEDFILILLQPNNIFRRG